MKKKKLYVCEVNYLKNNSHFIKWFDEIKDEIIIFFNKRKKISIFSSICPHFGGPITYNQTEKILHCHWHGLKFSHEGKCLNQKSFKACLNNYNFELQDNYIYITK